MGKKEKSMKKNSFFVKQWSSSSCIIVVVFLFRLAIPYFSNFWFFGSFHFIFYVLLRVYVHRCVRSISLTAIIIACSLVWWKSLLKRPVRLQVIRHCLKNFNALFKWFWSIHSLFFILSLALSHTQNIFFVKLIFFVKWKVAKKNMFLPFLGTHKKFPGTSKTICCNRCAL